MYKFRKYCVTVTPKKCCGCVDFSEKYYYLFSFSHKEAISSVKNYLSQTGLFPECFKYKSVYFDYYEQYGKSDVGMYTIRYHV